MKRTKIIDSDALGVLDFTAADLLWHNLASENFIDQTTGIALPSGMIFADVEFDTEGANDNANFTTRSMEAADDQTNVVKIPAGAIKPVPIRGIGKPNGIGPGVMAVSVALGHVDDVPHIEAYFDRR